MTEIVVLAPTRERPENAAQMAQSFRETVVRLETSLILVVDADDPTIEDYLVLPARFRGPAGGNPLWPPDQIEVMVLEPDESGSMAEATNSAARRVWDEDCIIGHVGDDHRFLSQHWDQAIRDALLDKPGVAYGDDGYWHEELPTAGFLSSIIPRTLGWLAVPGSKHYGIDDAWGNLGRGIGNLRYLPDVKIFQPGMEETEVNADDLWRRNQITRPDDRAAYFKWRDSPDGLAADVRRLRAVLG